MSAVDWVLLAIIVVLVAALAVGFAWLVKLELWS